MSLRWFGLLGLAVIPWLSVSAPAPAQPPPQDSPTLLGYSASSSARESEWEEKFRDGISPNNIRENMRHLCARPHHVGSPYDKDNAEWILARFKEWGFDAHIETFDVLFPTPKVRVLELLKPTAFHASLQEPPVAGDPTSAQTSEQLPTYNAYSADGDVTAPLVYVNYGNREDYEELDRLGISVKGAIVIARYGDGWRGVKPKVAAEHGAIGCIIFSDPKGDGYFQGDQYPGGGWRPKEGVQRGSVMDTDYPGRSVDARRRRDGGRQAPRAQGCEDHHQDPGAADLVCRRVAPAVGAAGRWRRPAGAARCRSPITWARDPRSCILR